MNMTKFTQGCETEGIALSKKKMQIKVEKLTFTGHNISKHGLSPDLTKDVKDQHRGQNQRPVAYPVMIYR